MKKFFENYFSLPFYQLPQPQNTNFGNLVFVTTVTTIRALVSYTIDVPFSRNEQDA